MPLTNLDQVHPLALPWLALDDYDGYNPSPNYISASSLLKPVRQMILQDRVPADKATDVDIRSLSASRSGTAVHDAIEASWVNPAKQAKSLELLKEVFGKELTVNPSVSVNPLEELHLELRKEVEFEGFTISGKFDAIYCGEVTDIKNTKTFAYGKDPTDYIAQLSIYKWLNPDIAVKDTGTILFRFVDWTAGRAHTKGYPPHPVMHVTYKLWSSAKVEEYIRKKLRDLSALRDSDQDILPKCTPQELWQGPPKYKFYANPLNTKRARVFDSSLDAHTHLSKNPKGVVVTVQKPPTRCKYCSAVNICEQAAGYIASGVLEL